MAENKGGSDLDVFEGLAKKKPAQGGAVPGAPTLPGAVPSQRGMVPPPPARQKTLLGMAMPTPPPPAPSQRASALPPPAPPARPSSLPAKPPSAPPPPPSRLSVSAPPPPPSKAIPAAAPPPMAPSPVTPPPSEEAAQPHLGAAPAIPAETPSSIGAAVDMDWDDDDEKTTIFDKGDVGPLSAPLPAAGAAPIPAAGAAPIPAAGAPASRTLLSTPAPSVAPAPRPASVPPPAPRSIAPAAPAPSIPAPAPVAPAQPSIAPPPASVYAAQPPVPASSGGSKTGLIIGATLAAAALLGIGVFSLAQPKDGKIAVFVAASGGRSIENVSVLVNGVKQCDTAPCRVELPKGVHEVKAIAPGYAPMSQGVTVIAGEEQAVNLNLSPASAGTGLRVAGASSVILSVDGKEVGPLPQELKDLSPGQHTLRFKGGDSFADEEKTINVVADQIQDLGTVELKLVRALASFDLRTPGASLTLVSGSERRPVSDPTKPVEVDASKSWVVEAEKAGFDSYSAPLAFGTQAEKTFVIELTEKAKPTAPVAQVQRPAPQAQPKPAPAPAPAAKPAAKGTCTLNINSIPVSNVVLNGRPLGGTPKLGVSVPAGSHTVVFIHPEYGKKAAKTTCAAGETKTVAMRLTK